ncbi:hypothetical protein HF521_004285 [Silurus meridionalis]|uniref:Uncharacterized protein n=1 Tax=Silurus meridionalis TaxID=175797 RepID=A0A8T0AWA9_SILME|nr:hypothetical protein HF521_004285 [Silurus meridionalis]
MKEVRKEAEVPTSVLQYRTKMLNHEPNNGTPLTETTKSEDVEHGPCDHRLKVKDHRKLAICSILCGLSCLGIVSLIYSIKWSTKNAEDRRSSPRTQNKQDTEIWHFKKNE